MFTKVSSVLHGVSLSLREMCVYRDWRHVAAKALWGPYDESQMLGTEIGLYVCFARFWFCFDWVVPFDTLTLPS